MDWKSAVNFQIQSVQSHQVHLLWILFIKATLIFRKHFTIFILFRAFTLFCHVIRTAYQSETFEFVNWVVRRQIANKFKKSKKWKCQFCILYVAHRIENFQILDSTQLLVERYSNVTTYFILYFFSTVFLDGNILIIGMMYYSNDKKSL